MSNPFAGFDVKKLPVAEVTDYHKDCDKYIIEYQEVEHVKMVGEKDTDFIKSISIEEVSRINRQESINSYADDVGILNIMKKVALSGDETLFNQTHRALNAVDGVDALGHKVEKVVDITGYQVDRVDALNSYKEGAEVYHSLDETLKGKKSFEEMAKMSDEDVNNYLAAQVAAINAQIAAARAKNQEEGSK